MNSTNSSLTEADLDSFRKAFRLPNSVETKIPTSFEVARFPPAGMVAVYADFFQHSGLSLPPTRFFKDLLSEYKVHLTQLCPDAVRTITRFEKISIALNLEPKVSSFRYFYCLKPSTDGDGWFAISTRPGIAPVVFPEVVGWKNRFFFMDVNPFFPENMKWRRLKVADPVRKFGEYDDWAVLRLSHVLAKFKGPYLEGSESFPSFEQDLSTASSLKRSSYSGVDVKQEGEMKRVTSLH